jgi:hypothetical protein
VETRQKHHLQVLQFKEIQEKLEKEVKQKQKVEKYHLPLSSIQLGFYELSIAIQRFENFKMAKEAMERQCSSITDPTNEF